MKASIVALFGTSFLLFSQALRMSRYPSNVIGFQARVMTTCHMAQNSFSNDAQKTNRTTQPTQPTNMVMFKEESPWTFGQSFNSTTLRFIFSITDEITGSWIKFQKTLASLQIQVQSKVERDISLVSKTGDFFKRRIVKDSARVVSGVEELSRPIMGVPDAIKELSENPDTWSLIRSGVNPLESPKLLGNLVATNTKQRAKAGKKQRLPNPLAADSLYRSIRALPSKLQYDYDRRLTARALGDADDNFFSRALPSSTDWDTRKQAKGVLVGLPGARDGDGDTFTSDGDPARGISGSVFDVDFQETDFDRREMQSEAFGGDIGAFLEADEVEWSIADDGLLMDALARIADFARGNDFSDLQADFKWASGLVEEDLALTLTALQAQSNANAESDSDSDGKTQSGGGIKVLEERLRGLKSVALLFASAGRAASRLQAIDAQVREQEREMKREQEAAQRRWLDNQASARAVGEVGEEDFVDVTTAGRSVRVLLRAEDVALVGCAVEELVREWQEVTQVVKSREAVSAEGSAEEDATMERATASWMGRWTELDETMDRMTTRLEPLFDMFLTSRDFSQLLLRQQNWAKQQQGGATQNFKRQQRQLRQQVWVDESGSAVDRYEHPIEGGVDVSVPVDQSFEGTNGGDTALDVQAGSLEVSPEIEIGVDVGAFIDVEALVDGGAILIEDGNDGATAIKTGGNIGAVGSVEDSPQDSFSSSPFMYDDPSARGSALNFVLDVDPTVDKQDAAAVNQWLRSSMHANGRKSRQKDLGEAADVMNADGSVAKSGAMVVETTAEMAEAKEDQIFKAIIFSLDVVFFLLETVIKAAGPVVRSGTGLMWARTSQALNMGEEAVPVLVKDWQEGQQRRMQMRAEVLRNKSTGLLQPAEINSYDMSPQAWRLLGQLKDAGKV